MAANVYGTRLKRLRESREMDQMRLAAIAGVAQSYISSLEAGKIGNPGVGTLERLADALALPLGVLLGITREPKPHAAPAPPPIRDHSPAAQQAALAAALARIEETP